MNQKFRFTAGVLLAGIIVFCIVFTAYPRLFGMGPVLAQEPGINLVEVLQDQGEAAWQDQDGNWPQQKYNLYNSTYKL